MNRYGSCYAILNIEKHATIADIKNAYKKLAKTYHPDKNSDVTAKAEFQMINEANAIC